MVAVVVALLAAVPALASEPPPFVATRLTDNVLVLTERSTWQSNHVVVSTDRGLVLVDPGASPVVARLLRQAIAKVALIGCFFFLNDGLPVFGFQPQLDVGRWLAVFADILSRVALVRPAENIAHYRAVFKQSHDVSAVLRAQAEKLATGPTGGPVGPWSFDGRVLHLSKVPRNRKAYDAAGNQRERRAAYCFCVLVREAEDPQIDPIFCYRAAGWARQLWEGVLDRELNHCALTHSILAGDPFCAWQYPVPMVEG